MWYMSRAGGSALSVINHLTLLDFLTPFELERPGWKTLVKYALKINRFLNYSFRFSDPFGVGLVLLPALQPCPQMLEFY